MDAKQAIASLPGMTKAKWNAMTTEQRVDLIRFVEDQLAGSYTIIWNTKEQRFEGVPNGIAASAV